ncbi:hypothetical protein B0A50_01395 [Salinomyces thailandicus]|uniref:Uncharacterized protein n=1 Tax=Salinomyces thailandicus TaxID=706561 RepID=A0A4U0UAH3_9PEZI|nr:hypothetical protein B0A50_01395 [Salinomyces thailandica]
MSSGSTANGSEPQIQHSFNGDAKILNSTYDSRLDIREALTHLQKALQRSEGAQVQVSAEIKMQIAGPEAKEHIYTVLVNAPVQNAEATARQVPSSLDDELPGGVMSTAGVVRASLDRTSGPQRSGSHAIVDDEVDGDVAEVRPPKRARTETNGQGSSRPSTEPSIQPVVREMVSAHRKRSSNETLDFMKQWHSEWVKQGGWLFDTLNQVTKSQEQDSQALQDRLNHVQNVLGQSINAASASTMHELASISKLIPWLENCRKTGAERVQAREEKWRSSSATFHDQSRRDREAAEKRLDHELQKQRTLLVKIAEANGVDVDDVEKDGDREDREASLGAQLTAELNMEASRAHDSRKKLGQPRHSAINIDDDDDDDDYNNE